MPPNHEKPNAQPTILLAEDNQATREFIAQLLSDNGMKVEVVENGQQAVSLARDGKFDLILLDILMPGLDGLDACRLIKSITQDEFIPIIILTAKTDIESRVVGLRIGADDYICKPFDKRELLARVNNLVRIKRMHDHVKESKASLEALSIKDELTGLYNYRYLQTRVTEEFKRAERYREPLACIMVDIDFFKEVNDLLGHEAGDEVLRQLSERLNHAVREIDVVARYGGEEFLLILPSTNFTGALAVADRVWRAVGSEPFVVNEYPKKITISLGVAVFPSRDIKTKDDLIRASDRALYQSKQEGRDGICVFQHQGYIYRPDSINPSMRKASE
jgi:two-component system cell cycle response regulator